MKGSGKFQGHWATYWQEWGIKKARRWSRSPNIGNAIVYGDWPKSTHIGVVVGIKYSNSTGRPTHVRTVEGNVDDKVTDMRWRKMGDLKAGRRYKASGYVSPVVDG